jgi:hypothetical protein
VSGITLRRRLSIRRAATSAALAAVLIAVCALPLTAWSTDRAVSASVVAMLEAHETGKDMQHLDLLVLWRGTPGWHMKGNGHDLTGGSGGSSGGHKWEYQQASYAGLTLTVETDITANTAKILDLTISLSGTNVVFVDDADSRTGPRIVETRWIEPTISGNGDLAVLIFKQSPELRDFLRCEIGLPDTSPIALAMMKLVIAPSAARHPSDSARLGSKK